MSTTAAEAREIYATTALAIGCRVCRVKAGDFCPPRPGATWSLCGERIYLGEAQARANAACDEIRSAIAMIEENPAVDALQRAILLLETPS